MRVIALMPVKNEEWVLPVTLPALQNYIDDLIVLDDSASDKSASLVRKFGGTVLTQEGGATDYSSFRSRLLNAGRNKNGTHFVWLDADEAFSSNFLTTFRRRLGVMSSGSALLLNWICLWKSPYRMRFDNSVWVRNFKDFVFCDDGSSDFPQVTDHEPRTPVYRSRSNLKRIKTTEGVVLHFQFVPFQRFLAKQAYVQCREVITWKRDPKLVNSQYRITKDSEGIKCIPIPSSWIREFEGLDGLALAGPDVFLGEIQKFFDDSDIRIFEALDIWDLEVLRDIFVSRVGRHPNPTPFTPSIVHLVKQRVESTKKCVLKFVP